MLKTRKEKGNFNKSLFRYAGLATQFFVGIAVAVFLGLKLDEWLSLSNPIFAWVLPLLVIIFSIYKIVKDTAPK